MLVSGINQEREVALASAILVWQTFIAKDSVRLRCLDSSDERHFTLLAKHCHITKFPTLVLAGDQSFSECIIFDPELLLTINQEPGRMQAFLTRLRSSIESGATLADLRDAFRREHLWGSLKLVYAEIKEFVR